MRRVQSPLPGTACLVFQVTLNPFGGGKGSVLSVGGLEFDFCFAGVLEDKDEQADESNLKYACNKYHK